MNSAFFSDLALLFIGVPITFFVWLIFGYFYIRKQVKKFKMVNENLSRVDKVWSFDTDSIVNVAQLVQSSSYTTFLILGIISCIFSWVGLFFSFFAWISIWFVKSRKERFILNTPLATNQEVSILVVNEVIKDFESRYFNS